MERNTDEKVVVLDKDVYRTLVQYAECGERDCGEGFFGKSMNELQKHARHFNPHLRPPFERMLENERLGKAERRRLVKKARRLSSQREPVRFLVDHQHRVIYPIVIIGVSSDNQLRLKYRALSDGWESCAMADLIFEKPEELPQSYRVLKEGEKAE
ncbi:hypothetical protein MPK70_gp061 [Erwinia phage pEa_SNUABM_33]|uniref:Uncharacterized protein n=1 Tax=Erwinia phage pEa_SNUABM_33 TaxID=2869556 RepID=A0AAE7XKH8_9CAUD|nr:hypothetical protein MPK70_gp061 [Erwinia phage pEa_SNUABM_33]QZE57937.1 hypothetical protein pEaSNUABM33_00061 [Erwinia phage pEa_SNUABM_33]